MESWQKILVRDAFDCIKKAVGLLHEGEIDKGKELFEVGLLEMQIAGIDVPCPYTVSSEEFIGVQKWSDFGHLTRAFSISKIDAVRGVWLN